jgi:hypothetical protein
MVLAAIVGYDCVAIGRQRGYLYSLYRGRIPANGSGIRQLFQLFKGSVLCRRAFSRHCGSACVGAETGLNAEKVDKEERGIYIINVLL